MENNQRNSLDYGQKSKHIYVDKRTVCNEVRVHWHSYFELEFIIDGSAAHFLNDKEYAVHRGSVYVLNPTDFHRMKPDSPLELWNVSFDEDMISDKRLCQLSSSRVERCFEISDEVLYKCCALAELIKSESAEENEGCARELCESLLAILMRNSTEQNISDNGYISGIRKAIMYLDVHFRENPSLAQVAAQAGLHKNYFSELFKRVTGESYSHKLNKLKIGYAKGLLAKGFSVTETCYQSGFGSLSNFFTVFRRLVGVSPDEYKKRG